MRGQNRFVSKSNILPYLFLLAWPLLSTSVLAAGEKYTLEVSSAGVGKPLKFARQYVKNIGRTIEVKKFDGDKIKGELSQANEDEIGVVFDETIKEGKKKKKVKTEVVIPMNEIKEAKIKVSF